MNKIQALLRLIDRFQQRHRVTAFLFGVQKKFGDDNAGNLIVNLAYAGFVSIFPLLLVLVTVLGIVAGHDPSLAKSVKTSALADFPIIGGQLSRNVRALHRDSALSLTVGLLGLLWGATGISQAAMYAMAQVMNLPGVVRPNFLSRLWRSFAFLGLLGLAVLVSGFLSSFGIVGDRGLGLGIAAEVVSVILNIGAYLLAFRILAPPVVAFRQLVPGALFGGVIWTVLQAAGGYLVARDLKNASTVYGFFGVVLGLLAWLYLVARVYLYATEINSVLAYRLWPRGLVQPPLTDADRRSLTLQVTENQRRPEQEVRVRFDASRTSTDEALRVAPSREAPYALAEEMHDAEDAPRSREQAPGSGDNEPAMPDAGDQSPTGSVEPAAPLR